MRSGNYIFDRTVIEIITLQVRVLPVRQNLGTWRNWLAALDLGSSAVRHVGSSPTVPTIRNRYKSFATTPAKYVTRKSLYSIGLLAHDI